MTWGLVAVAGATVVGGVLASNAAGDAASAQTASADKATALQKEIFDKQVQLQEPWRQSGGLALNKLDYLMGLSPSGTFQTSGSAPAGTSTGADASSSAPPAMETDAQIRARLAPQYTTGGGTFGTGENMSTGDLVVDQKGLDAAVQSELARQQAAQAAQASQAHTTQTTAADQATAANNDPAYGSLTKNFSLADFQADPGYQFRLDQGQQALERSAAAKGGLLSGGFSKDLTNYSQGVAAQEYGNAYDRYNANNDRTYNRLAAISGTGQTASNNVGAAAQNYGNNASSNIIGAGNATASGIIGGANAFTNAIGQGVSSYQQNQLMNKLFPPSSTGYNTGTNFGSPGYGV